MKSTDLCTMCYGVQARREMALHMARSRGGAGAAEQLKMLLEGHPEADRYFANAFDHPQLVVYTDSAPREPQLFTWGLVPHWVKDEAGRNKRWNQTLNARGETMFERPAFRAAARHRRALLFVDGFFEHFHFAKRAWPYFIRPADGGCFALAALWESWHHGGRELHSFAIVTCAANALMRRIHNNPGAEGPRMPLVLAEGEQEQWLAPLRGAADEDALRALVRPCPADAMQACSVRPLLGKAGIGNSPLAGEPFDHPELALVDPLAP